MAEVDKEELYDRQLRLWGAAGQRRLEAASVALLGCSALGTETLKNLVLPGVGSFTAVDGGRVEAADVGQNFFLSAADVGRQRAEAAAALLAELNPRTAPHWLAEEPQALVEARLEWFTQFSLVVAAGLPLTVLRRLAAFLHGRDIPLLALEANGFLGLVRLQVRSHTVVEARPSSANPDLRLLAPFPALEEYAGRQAVASAPAAAYVHIPFVALLLHELREWRAAHPSPFPSSPAEAKEFRGQLAAARRHGLEAANYEEAVAAVRLCYLPAGSLEPPANVRALFKRRAALGQPRAHFWVCVRALDLFYERHQCLPLAGSLPDMEADTASYQELQQIYSGQAEKDREEMQELVGEVLASWGRDSGEVSREEVALVCKNARFLEEVATSSIDDEYDPARALEVGAAVSEAMMCDMFGNVSWYLLLRAAEHFREAHGHYPGEQAAAAAEDAALLRTAVDELCACMGLSAEAVEEEQVQELCRYGRAQPHTMAALLGGVAAQEALKVLTRQFVPLRSHFLYNGHSSTGSTFAL
mmetsp:Transcript_1711/g.6086  ORF Transcript_1711/g.6086 Transcript_1711/m.6086 type:complete len:530 (-) Transcript_1711:40-1629(-)